jgi:hypothetical protein
MEAFGLAVYRENGMRNNPLKRALAYLIVRTIHLSPGNREQGFVTLPSVAISFNLTASSESSQS